ncbi:response regulator transcription factor [Mucilaginibacter paludis]|uniref:Two component transcriptional regulator, LuxR family n=1 Tax=Mucilaginibacter paludis DSM 18603 TaxID=714943 RepID=H1Y2D7_9SPHI|nr:response regulator transcription factor [Mucilaginibacter paludis]EHQ27917.1 two component transcriptional regulator, LuxR family [Mucilaginibacter paludis DSM 18603]
MIKIILAEDHNIVRNGIKSILDNEADMEVVFEAKNGNEVLSWLAEGNSATLILTDMNMPGLNGLGLIKEMKANMPTVILSMLDHENYVIEAITAGAHGYLLKSINKDELLFGLRHVADGGKYICMELTFKLLDKLSGYSPINEPHKTIIAIELSEREKEVLDLISEGYTNNEIADKLFTSRRTVEGHRQNLIEKTGVKNTPSLIRFALQNGLIK